MSSVAGLIRSLIPTPKSSPRLFHLALIASVLPIIFFISFLAAIAFYRAYVPQVRWRRPLYLQYGVAETPFAEIGIPVSMISQDQAYNAFVHLTVPVSDWNTALGNFMCNLTFSSPGGQSVTTSRPAIIIEDTSILHLLPFFSSRVHRMTVSLMESVVLSRLPKPITARLEVGRRDGWRNLGSGRELQTVSSELAIEAVLQGWGWWLYRYPVSSVLIATTAFFLTASAMTILGYFLVAPPFSPPAREQSQPTPKMLRHTPSENVPYRPYEKMTTQLGLEMADVSVETSVKSEETEGDLSDWSEALGVEDTRRPNSGARLRERIPVRSISSDSLTTVGGGLR